MFLLVNEQLEQGFRSMSGDEAAGKVVVKNEDRLDKLEVKIDKLCQRIFALAQPVANDLRFIMSSLRIGNEIERIGDISMDIIERAPSVKAYKKIIRPYKINELAEEVIKIAGKTSEAYANNNNELATELVKHCNKTEESCNKIFQQIISNMGKKSDVITIATDLILIVRDLERIVNHLKAISESVIFIVEGKRVS
jgi:phosphate transport system protein